MIQELTDEYLQELVFEYVTSGWPSENMVYQLMFEMKANEEQIEKAMEYYAEAIGGGIRGFKKKYDIK